MDEKVFGVYLTRSYDINQWCCNYEGKYIDTYNRMLYSFEHFVAKADDKRLKYEIRRHIGGNCHRNNRSDCCSGTAINADKQTIKELIKRLEL